MRYELYLRADRPNLEERQRLAAAMQTHVDLQEIAPGRFLLRTEGGGIHLELHPPEADLSLTLESAQPRVGLDFWITAGASADLARSLCQQVADWARRFELKVYDPQLGRMVDLDGLEAVQESIRRQSDYVTETIGLGAAGAGLVDVDPPPIRIGFKIKFYLGLAAFLLLLVLAAQFC